MNKFSMHFNIIVLRGGFHGTHGTIARSATAMISICSACIMYMFLESTRHWKHLHLLGITMHYQPSPIIPLYNYIRLGILSSVMMRLTHKCMHMVLTTLTLIAPLKISRKFSFQKLFRYQKILSKHCRQKLILFATQTVMELMCLCTL